MTDQGSQGNDRTVPKLEERAGHYRLVRKLGSGGFGVVYEARDTRTNFPCAVKRLELSEEDAERFRKEALYPSRIASRSLHVLGVQSFFHDHDGRYFYLVTELIPHGDLRGFLNSSPSPLPIAQGLEIGLAVARGLAAIHEQGIVHRDVKPRNILMDRKDGRWVPKITDFGMARSTGSISIGEFASPGYAAPEQVDLTARDDPGPDSDMFSFGMVLYELITGELVAPADNLRAYGKWIRTQAAVRQPSEVRPELSQFSDLDALLLGLLQYDRTARISSAPEVVERLSAMLRVVERVDLGPKAEKPNPGAADVSAAEPPLAADPIAAAEPLAVVSDDAVVEPEAAAKPEVARLQSEEPQAPEPSPEFKHAEAEAWRKLESGGGLRVVGPKPIQADIFLGIVGGPLLFGFIVALLGEVMRLGNQFMAESQLPFPRDLFDGYITAIRTVSLRTVLGGYWTSPLNLFVLLLFFTTLSGEEFGYRLKFASISVMVMLAGFAHVATGRPVWVWLIVAAAAVGIAHLAARLTSSDWR
jgi:hypothetical protein